MPVARCWWLLSVLLLPGLLEALPPAADPRIATLLDTLARVRPIYTVALSPDGRQLAWLAENPASQHSQLQLATADGRLLASPTPDRGGENCSETALAWAPDSRRLAFLSDCGDPRRQQQDLYVADLDSHAPAQKITHLNGYISHLNWSPDGRLIGFLYVPGASRIPSALAAAKPPAGEISVDGLELESVASVDAQTKAFSQLTPAALYAYEFSWSPDSRQIVYTAAVPPGDNNWWLAKLYTQAAQAGARPRLLFNPSTSQGPLHGLQLALPRWSPDGRQIAFIGGLMSDQGMTGGDLYALPANGGAAVNLSPGIAQTPAWFHWLNDKQLLVSQFDEGHSELAIYHLQGSRSEAQPPLFRLAARLGDGSALAAVSLSADGQRLAYVESSYTEAPEIHAGDLRAAPPPAVTALNRDLNPRWGKAESITWDNQGYRLQGWLLYPADYDPKHRYPLIVSIHGGPSGLALPAWPEPEYGAAPLSALGYFVFLPNPRGSYGEGERFAQANRQDFGHGDLRDVLAGIDSIERRWPVDEARLGITGWSYGGFATLFAITQTQRFHAAVAGAGIADWQSYYGQNLIDQWMIPFFGASVYDRPDVYAKSSPIRYVKQVHTPTLLLVGARDAECPAPQSFEFWHALRSLHTPTSLVVYPDEGHRLMQAQHRRDALARALAWFQHYLPPSEHGAP